MSIEFRIPDLLETVSAYRKPLNTNFDALDAGFQKWIDDAAFLSASHKTVGHSHISFHIPNSVQVVETCRTASADCASFPRRRRAALASLPRKHDDVPNTGTANVSFSAVQHQGAQQHQ